MLKHYILVEKEPVVIDDLFAWADWMETADRQIALDKFEGFIVSTVFLGLDHSFDITDVPVLFETMVFFEDKNHPLYEEWDLYQERYATWDEAEKGHAGIAEAMKCLLKTT
jgi:hypothetical protein